jgi:hypothetical protein
MTSAEVQAVRTDARARLTELVAVRDLLMPDRDDPLVLSELTAIESQIKAAKEALWPPRS